MKRQKVLQMRQEKLCLQQLQRQLQKQGIQQYTYTNTVSLPKKSCLSCRSVDKAGYAARNMEFVGIGGLLRIVGWIVLINSDAFNRSEANATDGGLSSAQAQSISEVTAKAVAEAFATAFAEVSGNRANASSDSNSDSRVEEDNTDAVVDTSSNASGPSSANGAGSASVDVSSGDSSESQENKPSPSPSQPASPPPADGNNQGQSVGSAEKQNRSSTKSIFCCLVHQIALIMYAHELSSSFTLENSCLEVYIFYDMFILCSTMIHPESYYESNCLLSVFDRAAVRTPFQVLLYLH